MVIDDGELSDGVSAEAEPDMLWPDAPLMGSGELFGAPPFDSVLDFEEAAAPSSLDLTVPERIWGEERADSGGGELQRAADSPFADDWWLPQADDDRMADEWLAADPQPTTDVDDLAVPASVATPAVPQARRRPRLAPAPVAAGPPSALRRVVGGIQSAPRMAALALVVATAGLFLALVLRGPATTDDNAPRQIDAANLQPASTLPASTAPPAPSTSLTTLVTSPQPAPTGEAPPTTVVSASPVATAPPTPVTTAAPRAPARAEPTVPAPGPAPTRPATVATPPPTTVLVQPEPDPEPETTVTTRRPRTTVPETTVAPSTTVPTSVKPPADGD